MPQRFSKQASASSRAPWPFTRQTHEALWGLAGATTDSRLFDGGEVLIEVVQYLDPAGKPRPDDYRLSDQGILNIAFGARRTADFNAVYRRAEAFGAKPNRRPVHLPGAGSVVYVNDPHGFSVEILRTTPGLADRIFGFEPRPLAQAPGSGYAPDRTPDQDQCTGRQGVGRDHRSRQHGPVDRFRPGHRAQGRLDTAPRRRFRTPDARPARSRPGHGASDSHEPAATTALPRH